MFSTIILVFIDIQRDSKKDQNGIRIQATKLTHTFFPILRVCQKINDFLISKLIGVYHGKNVEEYAFDAY